MKNFLIPILLVSGFFAFYEQSKPQSNRIIMFLSIGIFMLALMQLMSKVPSRSEEKNNDLDVNDESKNDE